MFCERAVCGKQYPKNMGQAAVSISISKSGQPPDFLKKYGRRDWSDTMNWKGSAGNGKVWTAVW